MERGEHWFVTRYFLRITDDFIVHMGDYDRSPEAVQHTVYMDSCGQIMEVM